MRFTLVIFAAVVFTSVLAACSTNPSLDNDKFFPQKVGEYTRMLGPQRLGSVSTTKYKKPDAEIFYYFGSFKTDLDAQRQFDAKSTCDFPDLPDALKGEVVKENILKEKTGKDVGKIRVCREKMSQLFAVVGDYKYSVRFSSGSSFVSAATLNGGFADLVRFTESLPFTSQIDLSALQELIATNSSTAMSADELMKKETPVKLTGEPYIKGKILIVRQVPLSISPAGDERLNANFVTAADYGLPKDQMAGSYEEADTILRIACSKGAQMADYVSNYELKQKFPAYSVNCKLSLIDKTIPAIIAQKDLIGTDLLEQRSISPKDEEIRAPEPMEKIKTFLRQLPKR